MAWFGADPGGMNAFGVALLQPDGSFATEVVSSADEAVAWLDRKATSIDGAGIDAPLWWSSGPSGDRAADQYLRKQFKKSAGTVQAANSLRGAALVQGVMLAWLLRKRYPQLSITEAHPKALLKTLAIEIEHSNESWRAIASLFTLASHMPSKDHERDGVLGAVAAREGSSGRWTIDLAARDRLPSEQDPGSLPWRPVSYWWPDPQWVKDSKTTSAAS
jgi:predicted RNase H-like nuclease